MTQRNWTFTTPPTFIQSSALYLVGFAVILLSDNPLKMLWTYRSTLRQLGIFIMTRASYQNGN